MSIKLTNTQLVMLSAAAQRDDRCLVASPNLKGGAAQKVAAKLVGAGLANEVRAEAGTPVWRRDKQAGQFYSLKLTAVSAKAIAVDDGSAPVEGTEDGGQREQAATTEPSIARLARPLSTPRDGTKLAQVIKLLQRDDGATIDDLIAATGWLAHTTRAALTGLRKRGYAVTIDRSHKERGSIYRISSDPTVEGNSGVVHSEDAQANSAMVRKKAQRQARSNARRAA
ncbi:MAG TPA: DUF3489 domain-containing protein [Roseiarcus sp.]|jgi:hypothetical protein